MGRKGNWLSTVKKALNPESKEKTDQRSNISKKKWFGKRNHHDPGSTSSGTAAMPPLSAEQEVKLTDAENEENDHAYSVAAAAAAADDTADGADQPVIDVVRVTAITRFAGKLSEEVAAIKIQTAFRGYMARSALRALRGFFRLKSFVEGPVVKRQAAQAFRCMQTLAHVQSQIRLRRIRMSEEHQALQKQLLQKQAKELESLQIEEEWDVSIQSKEQIEANLLSKHEAAMRRERALAYAFSHQQTWKNGFRSGNPMFMDSSNPSWGWTWLERRMAAHPWESRNMMDKELNNDHSSAKSVSNSAVGGEISRSYARYQLNSDNKSPTASQKTGCPGFQSPSTPKPASSNVAKKLKPAASPRGGMVPDDDSKSVVSLQSDRFRRHSIAGSSARDDESLASFPAVPSYMVSTKSAKSKSRLQSPLGPEKNKTPEKGSSGTPEKGSSGPSKKRLSFPPSPAKPRRHSGPPKVDVSLKAESNTSNRVAS